MFRIKRACARARVKNGSCEKKRNLLLSALAVAFSQFRTTVTLSLERGAECLGIDDQSLIFFSLLRVSHVFTY